VDFGYLWRPAKPGDTDPNLISAEGHGVLIESVCPVCDNANHREQVRRSTRFYEVCAKCGNLYDAPWRPQP